MDRYRIPLPNGRAQTLDAQQVRRIARGLGAPPEAAVGGKESPIVNAICALPIEQRADALAVALLRFGEKQDVETISHSRGMSPWRVWELEEAFRRSLAESTRINTAAGRG